MAKSLAILLVVVIINAIMVIAIINIAKRTDDNLKKYFLERTGDLFAHSLDGTEKKEEKEEVAPVQIVQKKQEPYYYREDKTVNYRDSNFREKYKDLKTGMAFDRIDTVNDVILQEQEEYEDLELSDAIMRINDQFDFNTIFELSTVDVADQLEILCNAFDGPQNRALNEYLKSLDGAEFSAVNFFNYIKQQAQLHDPNFYVKTAWQDDSYNDFGDNVITVVDNQIVDGIKVIHKSKLYDYSI